MGPKEKRRDGPTASKNPQQDDRGAKRVKVVDSRNIRSEPAHKALNEHNELDVGAFVKSHENEIRALEHSMGLAKKNLSSRAFQSVPRELRRRTASHNVKKVPKRLRNRAAKEMREDNTPTVTPRRRDASSRQHLRKSIGKEKARTQESHKTKETGAVECLSGKHHEDGELDEPKITVPKFKKRQQEKTWLPTHMYHTKRAHITEPKSPLWGFAIPLSPTEKSYRTTHRASSLRGCVAWDMTYMSCICVKGDERSLLGLMRSLGCPESQISARTNEKWRKGLRTWCGWLYDRDNAHTPIAKVTAVWQRQSESNSQRKVLLRVHPSAFVQLWEEVCKVSKIQKPELKVEDLRYELGSIEIAGPAATEALVAILRLCDVDDSVAQDWSLLAGFTSVKSLPENVSMSMTISDPRLDAPHTTVRLPDSASSEERLLQIGAAWPFDSVTPTNSLFDGEARSQACKQLPSQKAINRRKGNALPGKHAERLPTDPQIPVLLMASNATGAYNNTGSWTILLPWQCVSPVWYSLMQYPVSSGNNPRLGGLDQQRQLHFEASKPWFPGDYPGVRAGWEWELKEREQRWKSWNKRPKGKRVEWSSLDLGNGKKGEVGRGWACDWEYLLGVQEVGIDHENDTGKQVCGDSIKQIEGDSKQDESKSDAQTKGEPGKEANTTPTKQAANMPQGFHQVCRQNSQQLLDSKGVVTVSLSLVGRGHATTCARIYRLPSTNKSLLEAWLKLDKTSPAGNKHGSKSRGSVSSAAQVSHNVQTKSDGANLSDSQYPCIPPAEDLVGFVTAGNYNLGGGRSTAIGNLLIARMSEGSGRAIDKCQGLCIVREAGQSVGRLARWQTVLD